MLSPSQSGSVGLLDDDVRGHVSDVVAGSLSNSKAAKAILLRLDGRAPLAQVLLAAVDLLREKAAEVDRLELELDEIELEARRGRP
jgi:hypothetical protein